MPATRTLLKRTLLWVLISVVAVLVAWFIAAFQHFYNVHTIAPAKADAVVMLGGASKERLLDAMMLRADLNAPYLVISNTNTPGNATADEYCKTHSNKAIYPDVVCFTPAPMDTRGEATELGKLAAKNGWKNIVVVTSNYHNERAGTLMHQCVNAEVTMMATTPNFTPWQWLRRFVIETGGLLDVNMNPQCD